MDTPIVATAPDITLATIWRDLLVSAGIEAKIMGSGLEMVFPGASQMGVFHIIVAEDDFARARALLDEAEAAAAGADETEERERDRDDDRD